MHQVQKRLADFNGTQCGFCSPGMVMNMYSLLESRDGKVTMAEVENSFGGNICRCTGYRPILDAFKSLAVDADENLCRDIEDIGVVKSCPKTGTACAGKCAVRGTVAPQLFKLSFEEDREWYKVFTIEDIFSVFEKIGEKPYMLVAGNTAHGVYRRSPDIQVFIDIASVQDLKTHKITQGTLELGGNVTLTEAMEIFTKVAKKNKNFEYLREVVKHMDLIANIPVRNNGTLAGNLMIKNANKEFPSDLFLILETLSAKIVIKSKNENFAFTPAGFLRMKLEKKVISSIKIPSYDPAKFIFRSYKIMPRSQNAHAYINGGFLIELDDQRTSVISARLCFGGINPTFIHALNTEAALIGKNPFSNATLQCALNALKEELIPDWVLPDASPEFRKNLAMALFYKNMLNIMPETKASSRYRSGGKVLEREISSGTQVFDSYEKNWPLTKNIPKIEADVQCTGEAKYVNDIPKMPNEVFAAFAVAKKVHGKIVRIDATSALKIPGVVAFFSAKDIPGVNTFMPTDFLFVEEPEEIFCSTNVKFYGQPIGIILAESLELAYRAADLIYVHYMVQGKLFNPSVKSLKA